MVTVGKPMLVLLEFCEYGSLKTYLEKNEVDEVDRVSLAMRSFWTEPLQRLMFPCIAVLNRVQVRQRGYRRVLDRNHYFPKHASLILT